MDGIRAKSGIGKAAAATATASVNSVGTRRSYTSGTTTIIPATAAACIRTPTTLSKATRLFLDSGCASGSLTSAITDIL